MVDLASLGGLGSRGPFHTQCMCQGHCNNVNASAGIGKDHAALYRATSGVRVGWSPKSSDGVSVSSALASERGLSGLAYTLVNEAAQVESVSWGHSQS